jgi:alkanesulfonate monooxygenase SsuD/methylene tetrahydromethanopterin reductase-like flavin-dependent oxidoreductase (luciferase family)
VRFGVVILPEHRWPEARRVWQRAESLAFDHAWTYDHLAWRSLRDSPWFAAVPTLVAASLVTERLRLGTLVASPNFRHPVTFAKELVTLDDVSEGRVTVGIGAGGEGWDATMLGQEPWSRHERADRFAEFVELLDRLLREPAVSSRGRFYSADEARSYPGCVQQPRVPFAIAATGPRGMELAARYAATWVTTGTRAPEHLDSARGAAVVAREIEQLAEACKRVGRDLNSLDRLVVTGAGLEAGLSSVGRFRDTAGRYAEVGVTDLVVHWPRSSEPYATDPETFESIFS